MSLKSISILFALAGIASAQTDPKCVAPGTCTAPASAQHSLVLPTGPRH